MPSYLSQYTGAQHDAYASKAALIDLIYPVGAIYMSVNSISPATLFGGTWEAIEGKFLLGADTTYTAGTTGGEAVHILSENEMPSHNHTFIGSSVNTDSKGAHTHTAQSAGAHTHTTDSQGAHTHTRGTMDITGQWKIKGDSSNAGVDAPATASGAFSAINETASGSNPDGTNWSCGTGFNFKASNNWSGSTSSNGGHTHTAQSAGAHTHSTDSQGAHTHAVTAAGTIGAIGGGRGSQQYAAISQRLRLETYGIRIRILRSAQASCLGVL